MTSCIVLFGILVTILIQSLSVSSFFRSASEFIKPSICLCMSSDPNFEAHLPDLLKAGSREDRSSPDLAKELREKYSKMVDTKLKAAEVLKGSNAELAAELEEIADELKETQEKFVRAALEWDAWNRPDPDLARQLRDKVEYQTTRAKDPNFDAHLPGMMKTGTQDNRPDPDLPSELRILKMKAAAGVKRIAAKEIRSTSPKNEALAEELDDMADEMEETHARFMKLAEETDWFRFKRNT